jgi:flagellar L-ring protein precursor FlgH
MHISSIRISFLLSVLFSVLFVMQPCFAKKPKAAKPDQLPSLEQYITDVNKNLQQSVTTSPGSIYPTGGRLADGMRDLRASQVYDLVNIVVSENSSAVSQGATNTDRKRSANASITSALGPQKTTGTLANLLNVAGDTSLQGTGTTSRTSSLTTTLTAEVIAVLPNGNLVLQGQKQIQVDSEKQIVTVRGILRPNDLSVLNSVASSQLARLEVHVTGKGVIEDAVKQPNILYRLLLGILPF